MSENEYNLQNERKKTLNRKYKIILKNLSSFLFKTGLQLDQKELFLNNFEKFLINETKTINN